MLLSLSMIKYRQEALSNLIKAKSSFFSWYTVMKCNYERYERIKASTQRIKILASTTKTFKAVAKEEDEQDIENIIEGQILDEEDNEQLIENQPDESNSDDEESDND